MIFTESNTALLLTMLPHLLLLHPLLLILQDPVFLVSSLELAVRPALDTLSHHTHIVLSLTSLGFPYKCQLIIEAFSNCHLLLNKYNSTNFFFFAQCFSLQHHHPLACYLFIGYLFIASLPHYVRARTLFWSLLIPWVSRTVLHIEESFNQH